MWCVYEGLAAESDSDVVGQPNNGHVGVVGSSDRAAERGAVEPTTVRAHQAAHLSTDAAEHCRTRRLPARHHLHHSLRR